MDGCEDGGWRMNGQRTTGLRELDINLVESGICQLGGTRCRYPLLLLGIPGVRPLHGTVSSASIG